MVPHHIEIPLPCLVVLYLPITAAISFSSLPQLSSRAFVSYFGEQHGSHTLWKKLYSAIWLKRSALTDTYGLPDGKRVISASFCPMKVCYALCYVTASTLNVAECVKELIFAEQWMQIWGQRLSQDEARHDYVPCPSSGKYIYRHVKQSLSESISARKRNVLDKQVKLQGLRTLLPRNNAKNADFQ